MINLNVNVKSPPVSFNSYNSSLQRWRLKKELNLIHVKSHTAFYKTLTPYSEVVSQIELAILDEF